jgi:hypothetical protein
MRFMLLFSVTLLLADKNALYTPITIDFPTSSSYSSLIFISDVLSKSFVLLSQAKIWNE